MKCYGRKDITSPTCQQDINHKGHHDDGSHRWSMRVNGARRCYHCRVEEYDRQWGAPIFAGWPSGGMDFDR